MAGQVRVETIAIGDELLTGKISDTNSTFVANELFARGLRLQSTSVIPDEITAIQRTLRERARHADFAICFGGLGPTSDDRTAEAVAGALGVSLTVHAPTRERLEHFCRLRQRDLTPQMLKQAILPAGTLPLDNEVGLAVGFSCELGTCRFYFLPGVPSEMRSMFLNGVLPQVQERLGTRGILHHRIWRCLGIPESELQRVMVPIEQSLPANAWLGYRTRFPENHLTLYWRVEAPCDEQGFAARQQAIREIVAPWSYTEQDKDPEELVLEELARRHWRIALAESCTGGLVVHRLTRIAGSSEFVWGGYTSYQVAAKEIMLGVKLDDPTDAVSRICSRRLAEETLRHSGCDVAAAITGYMGPSGGTQSDPLGTIHVCVVGSGQEPLEKRVTSLTRNREQNQWGAATHLLNTIRIFLERDKSA